jgi:hypothetical protein
VRSAGLVVAISRLWCSRRCRAGASDVEHDGVVHEPFEDGCGDDGVTEDGAPVGQSAVGGGDGGVAFLVVDHPGRFTGVDGLADEATVVD